MAVDYYPSEDGHFAHDAGCKMSTTIFTIARQMVGIWAVSTWMQLGSPERVRIVEMGPGRGTLMADLLRGTAAFASFSAAVHVDMVEVSPALRGIQARTLACGDPAPADEQRAAGLSRLVPGRAVPVTWHRSLDAVPEDMPTLYIGHEFIDALPVHQFQKTGVVMAA